ncbi:30S ribosomal protein S3 [Trichonephila clavata]|uniref:Small ribosomal subunit protein uS3c n=1 Tax=Trichonephila clavata TaxID=2740835 RepID=A0A8X6H248_TRICU|nr:30S ribosomal protein S3 [Trichonephila clavata]
MGNVNPKGFRLKIINTWSSIWYAEKGYKQGLHQDLSIRSYINESFKHAGVSKVIIERTIDLVSVIIHSSRPGVIIVGVKRSEIDAVLISNSIAQQLEKRVSFRRAMKKAIQSCLRMGARGIKVSCSGRLGGAEIARTEWYKEGRLPLHTLRANIDYAFAEAKNYVWHHRS